MEKYSESVKQRYERLKSSGVCVSCGKKESYRGTIMCEECREKNIKRARSRYLSAKSLGLCGRCKKAPATIGIHCESCIDIVRSTARESQRNRMHDRRSRGLCTDCKIPETDVSGAGRCIECHCKQEIKLHHMIGSSWVDLVDIWNSQHGVCALSGLPMPLKDAEIDHITPVHSGGTCSKDNLRWVLKIANRMKGKMLDADLIAMCKSIVLYMDH